MIFNADVFDAGPVAVVVAEIDSGFVGASVDEQLASNIATHAAIPAMHVLVRCRAEMMIVATSAMGFAYLC